MIPFWNVLRCFRPQMRCVDQHCRDVSHHRWSRVCDRSWVLEAEGELYLSNNIAFKKNSSGEFIYQIRISLYFIYLFLLSIENFFILSNVASFKHVLFRCTTRVFVSSLSSCAPFRRLRPCSAPVVQDVRSRVCVF